MSQQYPIRVVARMTGLSVDTLRAWERRYKAVTPSRAGRGRAYSDTDVQRLLDLQQALRTGYSIGEASALPDVELKMLADRRAPVEPPRLARPVSPAGFDPAMMALESFDGGRLNLELGRLATLLTTSEFVHQVALPFMREVGERWHAGTLHAAQEHLATESVRNLLGAMTRLHRAAEDQPRFLATTPAGELHDLGILSASVIAGTAGYQVACLGPNLPAAEILFAVQRFSPRILLLGMTTPEPSAIAVETVREVAAGMPQGMELWFGGTGALVAMSKANRQDSVYVENLRELERLLAESRQRGTE